MLKYTSSMADEISHIKLDLGKLSKAITTLIKKMASAAGIVYAPTHTRRMAKAKADAALIKAQSELEVASLRRRAANRVLLEEMRNQENIESITESAFPLLEDRADASNVDDDWVANFFAKCKMTSRKELQLIWARILAGQVNKPGSFSKRTVNFLAEVDEKDAKMFTLFCSFLFKRSDKQKLTPLIPSSFYFAGRYAKTGLTENVEVHLKNIGLIYFEEPRYASEKLVPGTTFEYFGRLARVVEETTISYYQAELTVLGEELATIVEGEMNWDLLMYLLNRHPENSVRDAIVLEPLVADGTK